MAKHFVSKKSSQPKKGYNSAQMCSLDSNTTSLPLYYTLFTTLVTEKRKCKEKEKGKEKNVLGSLKNWH